MLGVLHMKRVICLVVFELDPVRGLGKSLSEKQGWANLLNNQPEQGERKYCKQSHPFQGKRRSLNELQGLNKALLSRLCFLCLRLPLVKKVLWEGLHEPQGPF